MWIRDSTSQMNPYLPYAPKDPSLKNIILGVIYMQAQFLNIDPYANAFKMPDDASAIKVIRRDDGSDKVPAQVWEEKYEIDSLANFLRLSHSYWNTTCDSSFVQDPVWMSAVEKVIKTIHQQQEPTYNNIGETQVQFAFACVSTKSDQCLPQINPPKLFTSLYSRQCDLPRRSFWMEEVTQRLEQG